MTNATRSKLSALYKRAKKDKGSQMMYNYYVNMIRRMGLTAIEYEEAVQKLAGAMQL